MKSKLLTAALISLLAVACSGKKTDAPAPAKTETVKPISTKPGVSKSTASPMAVKLAAPKPKFLTNIPKNKPDASN